MSTTSCLFSENKGRGDVADSGPILHGLVTELVAKWDAKHSDVRCRVWILYLLSFTLQLRACHCLGLSFLLHLSVPVGQFQL